MRLRTLLLLACLAPADARVLYREDFRNYGDTAAVCTEGLGIRIGNDPIWTQTAEANCAMTAAGFVFRTPASFTPLAEYDVLFRFRFQADANRRLRLHLRGAAGELVLTVAADAFTLHGAGVDATAALPAAVPARDWHLCAVTVRQGRLTVQLDFNRLLRPVLTAAVPVGALTGLNFYGFQDSPFSLTDIVVREPAPLPDRSLAALLPTLPPDPPAAYTSGAAQREWTVPVDDVCGATVRCGLEREAVKLAVVAADGARRELTFSVTGTPAARDKVVLPDAVVEVKGLGGPKSVLAYHVRPRLRRYHTSYSVTDTYRDLLRDWDQLPRASECPLKVECRRNATGLAVWLNGRYAGELPGAAKELRFTLAPTASLKEPVSTGTETVADPYLPLDLAALRRARAFAGAACSVPPGLRTVAGVPLRVAPGAGSADVGLVREGQGNWALEVDEFLARSAFDGLLTEVHFAVPAAPYTRAWVLCAVDPDPAKDPVLTTRLTRYLESGAGNNLLADTTTRLPRLGETPGAGITAVGSVTHAGGQVPLYLVEVPLRTGAILDLAMGQTALNFEFLGKTWENHEQLDHSGKPDPRSTSAVQLFGVTLERSPVGLELVQAQPGNVFAGTETAETTAVLKALAPASGHLAWTIRDVDGRQVGHAAVPYRFGRAGEEQTVRVPLAQAEPGWYELSLSVLDAAGKALLEHPARFALLGPDERQAGYESPFGVWWFDGAHNTPRELAFAGPLLRKAGIRCVAWTRHTEAEMAPWGLTKPQVNTTLGFKDLDNPQPALAKAEAALRRQLQDYPHLREVLIFHESGPGNDVPVELVGLRPELTAAQHKREQRYADLLNLAGQFYREKFPQLKLIVGNNSCSQACIAAILRHGGKPEYIDSIGIESPSQVYPPEKLVEGSLQGLHLAQDTAKLLSGRDLPANGCYEFVCRSERDMGEQQQAEWYARDLLISLANRFTLAGPGILFDCASAYYNTLWGGSGLLGRGPYGYPKRSYVAYATLTNVLDRARLLRQVPTGSTTVYALEFERADQQRVAALWAARGEAEFTLTYAADTAVRVVDLYGRRRELRTVDRRLTVTGGTAATYVLARQPLSEVTLGARRFPRDAARARRATVVAPLDRAESLVLDSADAALETPLQPPLTLPLRQRGEFALRGVEDPQRGRCVELELRTDRRPTLSQYITEYTTLRLSQPVPVPGEPTALGVWVKGNSNWGRVMFEVVDAEGEVWRSVGTGGWGCDILDWPANLAVNFDGWNFVALPLGDTGLFPDHSPGPRLEQWVSNGGNKRFDFPLRLTALMVEMNRRPLALLDFEPVSPTLRLRDFGGIYER